MRITKEQIDLFWQARERFLKITLTTEQPHPKTHNLSQLCQSDLVQAINTFHEIELLAVKNINQYVDNIYTLKRKIAECLDKNGNIVLVGCGASARLAVLLRRLWEMGNPQRIGRVVSICAAGDVSLIKSIEQFEDSAEYGIKQLQQQSFSNNDLLIGLTASGESPFVIACIEYAINNSNNLPWLVCNNYISDIIKRNPHHVATNPRLSILELNIGEMALTGSTRLQATTAMQIAVGIALVGDNKNINQQIDLIYKDLSTVDLKQLAKLIEIESSIIQNSEYILYETSNSLLGLSMLADITERSPTFNISPFENYSKKPQHYSQFYLCLTHTDSAKNAWQELLNQRPVCLNWSNFPQTTAEYIYGFDISKNGNRAIENTVWNLNMNEYNHKLPKSQYNETWSVNDQSLTIKLQDTAVSFKLMKNNLSISLFYKLLLNTYSTIMFGRLGYYEGNLMTSLTPSNFKLMDRAIRYIKFILQTQYKMNIPYEKVAGILFDEINKLEANQSIVKKVVGKLI